MDITTEIISQTSQMLTGLLQDYHREIDEAYQHADPALDVKLTVKYAPDKDGIKLTTGITFVKDKAKNSISVVIDPKQRELFADGTTTISRIK